MTAADVPVVAAMEREVFPTGAWSEDAWTRAVGAGPDIRLVVMRTLAALVGYAGIIRTGSDADVLTVAVDPGERRRGYGRLLVEELLQIAERWRSVAVFLEVAESNEIARGLYHGLGFAEIGQRRHYYGQGQHAVTMRRQLREPMGSQAFGGER